MDDELKGTQSEEQSIMTNIISKLREKGFRTTQNNPFFTWINQGSLKADASVEVATTRIYVSDIAMPKVAPYDIAYVEIQLKHDSLYLALTICFHSVMQGLLEPEEFNEVFSKHDEVWMPQLVSLLQPVEMAFSLKWDTEYDDTIEDSLYGYFPLPDIDKVITAVKSINALGGQT